MRDKHVTVFIILVCILIFFTTAVQADINSPNYTLTDTIHLPGAVKWDYLVFDADHHRLFITRGESVDVLDIAAKKIVGTIPDTHGVHGVALAPELNRGFTSNGAANNATIFDLTTLKPIATVPTGTKPDAIVYDAATQRVFTANGGSGDLTVIDAKQGAVIGTIPLGGGTEFAVDDGNGHLYVNLEDKAQTVAINAKDMKVTAHFDLAPACDGPTGLSIDKKRNRLFVSCHNKKMLVIDAASGKIIGTLPIGEHSDATAFDPGTGLAFSSNSDGTLNIIGMDEGHYAVLQTAKTLPTARTMALDPATHDIYLAAAETDGIEPATAEHPHPRPHIKPDSFMILVVGTGR